MTMWTREWLKSKDEIATDESVLDESSMDKSVLDESALDFVIALGERL